MADLFLHLSFARRLRLAEGLHPLVGETLTRRQSLVALGAALPSLPGIERARMSWFRRLFSGGSDTARWQKNLAPSSTPRAEFVKRFIVDSGAGGGLGPMARLALGLGLLAHELLEAKLAAGSSTGPDKAAIERAQARLWMQAAIPTGMEAEWRPIAELGDGELHRRTFEHLDAALKAAFGAGPGKDALHRWARGLVSEVAPAVPTGLPPSLAMADHAARGPHFENNGFVGRVQDAQNWFVLLANRLGERATVAAPDATAVIDALCAGGANVIEADGDASAVRDRWISWHTKTRKDTLERGRNDKPAFIEGIGEVKPVHRSNAFTGMMNLSDLPPEALPPELRPAALPPPSDVLAPPVPHTMEVSLASLEGLANPPPNLPPLPLDASGPLPMARPTALPPTHTQEISVAQIEGEARAFAAPAMTQEISVAQIESEARAFSAPALTQEISVAQIEGVAAAGQPPKGEPPRE